MIPERSLADGSHGWRRLSLNFGGRRRYRWSSWRLLGDRSSRCFDRRCWFDGLQRRFERSDLCELAGRVVVG